MISESDLRVYLDKWDKKYWATYKVLDILQKVFYRSPPQSIGYIAKTETQVRTLFTLWVCLTFTKWPFFCIVQVAEQSELAGHGWASKCKAHS